MDLRSPKLERCCGEKKDDVRLPIPHGGHGRTYHGRHTKDLCQKGESHGLEAEGGVRRWLDG